mmetsp:Transcript_12644/g.23362  ORF Transcript_12644/g.23362 Transcript_12644/m.23362 type:complete len:555 (+) Transcript_12644:75-1739(+)
MEVFELEDSPEQSFGDRFDYAKTSCRGWSMRRGHRKKVLSRARMSPGYEYFAMGPIPTSVGRSVYKRTCNSQKRYHPPVIRTSYRDREDHMAAIALKMDIEEGLDWHYWEDTYDEELDMNSDADWMIERSGATEGDDCNSSSPRSSGGASWEWVDDDVSWDSGSTRSSISNSSLGKSGGKLSSETQVGCCDVGHAGAPSHHTRWEEALHRAAVSAEQYTKVTHATPDPIRKKVEASPQPVFTYPAPSSGGVLPESSGSQKGQNFLKPKRVASKVTQIKALLESHQELVQQCADETLLVQHTAKLFEAVRDLFLLHHETEIWRNIKKLQDTESRRHRVGTSTPTLQPLNVSPLVQLRFLKAFLRCGGPELSSGGLHWRPLWHGTRSRHMSSISKRGLLIPGTRPDVRVVNGSAHGVGIYTARVESPWLSYGFASRGGMLVCAGFDDSVVLRSDQLYNVGAFTVKRESNSVRHVGDAVVFYDHRLVAPLFAVSSLRQKRDTLIVRPRKPQQHSNAPVAPVRSSSRLLSWMLQRGHRRRMTAGAGRGSMWVNFMDSK